MNSCVAISNKSIIRMINLPHLPACLFSSCLTLFHFSAQPHNFPLDVAPGGILFQNTL